MQKGLVGSVVLMAVATLASGQEPAAVPATGPQAPPVFEAGAELVRLDLVVRDEKDRLVRDLRADEIQVFEDGQPVAISSLRLVDADETGSLRVHPLPAPAAEAALPAGPVPAAVSEEPPLASVVVLLFDTLQGQAAQAARKAALEFAGRPFPKNTWFGVFKATRIGLVTVHAFTEDPGRLESAIQRATMGADVRYDQTINLSADTQARPLLGSNDPAMAAMRAALANMTYFESLLMREERGRNSLYPLLTLARSLRGVQGRKTLLHFSQGIEVTPDIDYLLTSAISEANRSNLAIYAFDARGLFVADPNAGAWAALRSTIPAEAFMGPADLAAMQQGGGGGAGQSVSKAEIHRPEVALDALRLNVQENLRELAEGTSGFLVANNNDLRPGLNRVSRDLRSFYEIAYTPPNPAADGTFRHIEVEVARDDVRVRVRKGYYALPPGVPVIHPWEVSLAQALEGDVLPRGLSLRAGAVRLPPETHASRAVVLVEIPLGDLETQVVAQTGHWSTHVSSVAYVKDADDRIIVRMSQDWPLEGLGPASALRGRNVLLKRTVDLAPGRYTLEAAAQDRLSGRLAARRVPFVIPEPSSGLSLGSVAIVRFQPAPPDAQDPGDPLLIRGGGGLRAPVRVLPVLGAPISVEGGAVGVLASVMPDPDAGPVSVTVEFRRGSEVLAQSSPEVARPDRRGRITLAHSFDLPSLEPGRYQVHVHVRQGEAVASEATSFKLERASPIGVLPGTLARADTQR